VDQKPTSTSATVSSSASANPKGQTASNATTRAANTTPLFQRLKLGPHSRDVTSEKLGTTFAIIGAENFRKGLMSRATTPDENGAEQKPEADGGRPAPEDSQP
jgi:hypothetical protein